MGIADARILINQEELPFLDGSSQEYCQRLRSVTSDESGRAGVQRRLRFLRPLLFETGPAQYVIFPSDQLRVSYLYQSQQPLLKFQTACFDGTNYESQIAPARTFGFLNEISPLLAAGLVRGASLANSVVFGNKHLLNNRLRFPNEPARHKILDFLGDMAPLSLPLTGWVLCLRGGHRTNAEFVRFLHEALSRQDGVVAE
jgi:UDP-3-O-[3-hydroxymyristoyl] N-acetylglucosamine deacetylase